MGLAHKFNAQLAVFSTTAPYPWQSDILGISAEASWLPDMQKHFPDGNEMNFPQRVLNTLQPIYWHLFRRFSYLPRVEKLLRENLGLTEMPDLEQLEKQISLVLTNTHFAEEYGRSIPPNLIPIGGMH
jgi:glucuronosyltransferase